MFNRRLLVSTSGGGSDPVPELPDQDTLLLDYYEYRSGKATIKIPEGCNVVKVYFSVSHESTGVVEIDVTSDKTGVWWCGGVGNGGCGGETYIGVTSGAEYTLSVDTGSETDMERSVLLIYYSKSINTKTPDIKDYIK